MICIRLPPAARSRLTIFVRLAVARGMSPRTQPSGSALARQTSTSLPPIEIVTSPTRPGWRLMNATAACTWVWPGKPAAPGTRPAAGQLSWVSIEVVVAPPQPKLTSVNRRPRRRASLTSWLAGLFSVVWPTSL